MKNYFKPIVLVVFLSISLCTLGQMAVVEFMRVKPGMAGKYLEVEKDWKKIHEARLKAGQIINWALYQPIFSGADDPYQFVIVTLYKDLESYEMESSDSIAKIAYPQYSDKDWDSFFEKTSESRVLGQVFAYHLVTQANAKALKPVKYLQISNMYVKPGSEDAYIKLEKDYFKPMHEAAIKGGQMELWSIWEKYPGDYTQSQFTAVNEYSSISQMEALDYQKIFKKVFPAMNINDLGTKTNKARTLVQSDIWRMLDHVSAN